VGDQVHACVRPESTVLHENEPPVAAAPRNDLKGAVEVSSFLGTQIRYQIDIDGGPPAFDIAVSKSGNKVLRPSTPVHVTIDASDVMLLSD
jgi:hypothetical protein